MDFLTKIKTKFLGREEPEHLRRGRIGEQAAKQYLQRKGLKFLTANFRSGRGEIDLIFRERCKLPSGSFFTRNETDCLVFVEVKTRSSETWGRPAAAVNARKKRLLSLAAMDYLRLLENPQVKIRFDIVEVLLTDGAVHEVRHLPGAFSLSPPFRHG